MQLLRIITLIGIEQFLQFSFIREIDGLPVGTIATDSDKDEYYAMGFNLGRLVSIEGVIYIFIRVSFVLENRSGNEYSFFFNNSISY